LLSIEAIKNLGLEVKFIILNDINEEIPLDNFDELSNFTDIPIFRLGYNKDLDSNLMKYLI
jgi:dethiobiotin synthetase